MVREPLPRCDNDKRRARAPAIAARVARVCVCERCCNHVRPPVDVGGRCSCETAALSSGCFPRCSLACARQQQQHRFAHALVAIAITVPLTLVSLITKLHCTICRRSFTLPQVPRRGACQKQRPATDGRADQEATQGAQAPHCHHQAPHFLHQARQVQQEACIALRRVAFRPAAY